MSYGRRIIDALRRPQNIFHMGIVIVTLVFAVISLMENDTSFVMTGVLVILGILALMDIISEETLRFEMESFKKDICDSVNPNIKLRKEAMVINEAGKDARDILIIGQSLSAITGKKSFFIDRLKAGCHFRLVVVNPNNTNLINTLVEFTKNEAHDIRATLTIFDGNIKRIREDAERCGIKNFDRQFEIKMINYPPTMSYLMLDGDGSKGVIYADMLLFSVDTDDRPNWCIIQGSQWYSKMHLACESTWEHAETYRSYEYKV